MKNVLKLLVVIIALSMTTQTFAQKFGVKAGLNMSNIMLKDDDDTYSDDFKMTPGFRLGATAEFPINDMISFETGLLVSTTGYKSSEEESGMEYKVKMSNFNVNIPLTVKAGFEVGGAKVYGAVGPYLGVGVSGKVKTEMSYLGETESETTDVKWGSGDEDDIKRLDFGLNVGAGIAINAIEVGLFYDYGLANISAETDGGFMAKNRVLGLTVGYKFGGK
jgi:hypothetical protein